MIRNYLKVAWRNLTKNKIYSFINIFGLTIGLASFLLIALYIFDELTYDRFHKKADSIYRIVETKTMQGKQSGVVSVAYKISEHAEKSFPEVIHATRFSGIGRSNVSNNRNSNIFYEFHYVADESFLKVFDFPVIDGDPRTALSAPYSAEITEETALKMFGESQVVGEALITDRDSLPYKITAVVRIPNNSHLTFNVLFSESTLNSFDSFKDFIASDWGSNTFVTYLLLRDGSHPKNTAAKINTLVKANRTPPPGTQSKFDLQPLTAIHFHSAGLEGDFGRPGNMMHLYVFGIIAVFVLLIACINYMNLTTARFSARSKEIAIRKVTGAEQKDLVSQFLYEAFMMAVIALILSIGIVKLVLPRFNAFTEKQLELGLSSDYRIWLGVFLTVLLVGAASGVYPALFQARFKPNLLLKNKVKLAKGTLSIRRILVITQFAISIVMIIATLIVYQQLKFVDKKDMGFNKDQLLVVDINSGLVRRAAETIKNEYEKLAGVSAVSVTSRVPGEWKILPKVKVKLVSGTTAEATDMNFMAVDANFLKTFEVKLLRGRNFSETGSSDSLSVLLNETAGRLLGITEPAQQQIAIPSIEFSGNASTLDQEFRPHVVGLVKDFNFQSLRERVGPMVLAYRANPVHTIDYFTARIETSKTEQLLTQMEDVLRRIDAEHLFEYHFLDKQWDLFYREDQKRKVIFLSVAFLTILVACLGLFGLATFAAEQRIKEIGIRKVLGATVVNIVALLAKDLIALVIIASFIAFPIAWLTMENWLQDFAYRISIQWWVFVVAAMAALFIALGTVSFQAIRAALANPVRSLRSE